jgi:hypothetical protein
MGVGEAMSPEAGRLDWKGRRRKLRRLFLALVAGTSVVVVLGVGTVRVINLWGIPDAPEPFDRAEVEGRKVAAADNAVVLYRKARRMLGGNQASPFKPLYDSKTMEWSGASPELQKWAEEQRPALETWRRGTDRPDAAPLPGGEHANEGTIESGSGPWLTWAMLEASRLEDEGDLEEAWLWHKARLRATLLMGRGGGVFSHRYAANAFNKYAARAQAWADRPDMQAPLLHQAIADVEAMAPLHGLDSDTLKREYLLCLAELDVIQTIYDEDDLRRTGISAEAVGRRFVPPGPLRWPYRQVELLLMVEPERSRRLARLVWANWLAQADKPPAARTKVVSQYPLVFEADPGSNPPVAPDDLARLAAAAPLLTVARGGATPPPKTWLFSPASRDYWPVVIAEDRRARASLIVGLAIRIHELEHGGKGPANLSDLVGEALSKLPDDFVAPGDDPASKPDAP